MKVTGDAEIILYQKLLTVLAGQITGGVFRKRRPDSSAKEDVVVNAYRISQEYPQIASVNINVHVPGFSSGQQALIPDTARMKVLSELVLSVLTDYTQAYTLTVEDQRDIYDEGSGDWYVWIPARLTFYNN